MFTTVQHTTKTATIQGKYELAALVLLRCGDLCHSFYIHLILLILLTFLPFISLNFFSLYIKIAKFKLFIFVAYLRTHRVTRTR
jgi:hypothetical protein